MTLHLSSIEGSGCLGNNPGSFLGRLKDQMFPECGVLHPPKKINVMKICLVFTVSDRMKKNKIWHSVSKIVLTYYEKKNNG